VELYLLPSEAALLKAMPVDWKGTAVVQSESIARYETDAEIALRLQIAICTSVSLAPVFQKIKDAATDNDRMRSLVAINFASLSNSDLAEIFFLLGTRAVNQLIVHALLECRNEEDLSVVSTLTIIRHALLLPSA